MKVNKYLFLAYSVPVCLLLWFVLYYGVNVPYMDQWELVNLFKKYEAGDLKFLDLFAQHNEHRIFFPKIIFIVLAFITNWNIKAELYSSICLVILNAIFIYKISEANVTKNNALFHTVIIISLILVCSLGQYANFICGFQIAWFLVNTLLVFSVFILFCLRNWSVNLRQLAASLCCLVASFSLAYGLLSWIAIIPMLLAIENKTRLRVMRTLISITLFLISYIIYHIGYQQPSHHPEVFYFWKQPLETLIYFLVIIGAPIGASVTSAAIVGAIVLLSFLVYNIYILQNSQSQFAYEAAPWLSIGWFSISTSLLITIGRAGFGVGSALVSRYTTVLILLIISCLQMYRLWTGDSWAWHIKHSYRGAGIFMISCLFIVFFVGKSADSMSKGYRLMLDMIQGKTCLEVVYFLDTSTDASPNACLRYLFPSPPMIRVSAIYLEKLGWRIFPKELAFVENPSKLYGYIDIPRVTDQPLRQSKHGQLELGGWAILPDSRQLPKTVFLSYGEQRSFFAHGSVYFDRPDVAKALHSSRYNTVGWQAVTSLQPLPLGETVIKAWVYDREGKRFVKLQGEPKIQVVE